MRRHLAASLALVFLTASGTAWAKGPMEMHITGATLPAEIRIEEDEWRTYADSWVPVTPPPDVPRTISFLLSEGVDPPGPAWFPTRTYTYYPAAGGRAAIAYWTEAKEWRAPSAALESLLTSRLRLAERPAPWPCRL